MAVVTGGSTSAELSNLGYGLILANSLVDTTNDINVGAGGCPNSTRAVFMTLASQITKRIDAVWAVGTNAGGLDTGTVANSTWYHIHLIRRPDTGVVDALFSLQSASPTMPTNYTQSQRIGAVYRNSGAAIKAFSQLGDEFLWKSPVLDVDTSTLGTTAVSYTLSVPTLAAQVQAIVNMISDSGTANNLVYVSSPDQNDEAASSTAAPLATLKMAGSASAMQKAVFRVSTAGQVRAVAANASTTLRVATLGWIDRRWRS